MRYLLCVTESTGWTQSYDIPWKLEFGSERIGEFQLWCQTIFDWFKLPFFHVFAHRVTLKNSQTEILKLVLNLLSKLLFAVLKLFPPFKLFHSKLTTTSYFRPLKYQLHFNWNQVCLRHRTEPSVFQIPTTSTRNNWTLKCYKRYTFNSSKLQNREIPRRQTWSETFLQ